MAAERQPDIEKLKEAKIPTRRVRMLMINPGDFMYLFTKGIEWRKRTKLLEGVPDDAKMITLAAEPVRGGVIMVVESQEYEPVPVNEMPPVQRVEIQTQFGSTKKKAK